MKGTVSTHPSNLLDVNSSLYSIKEEFIDDASEDSFQDDQMGSNQAQNKFILVEEEQVSSEPNDMDILEWYSTFGKELREKAYVDLERKEDLGRVWFYDIKKWDAENIATAQGEIIYAFIPRKEGKYLPPPPERNRENPEEYEKWMLESQKLGLEVEEIRELWRRSRDGTLMVTAPDGSMEYMQILTMDDGSLVFSQPADKIAPPEILDREVPHILPMPKEPTAARIERALPEPTSPKINNPMAEPGWFSWLGYVFGIHTAYTDYMAEQETIKQWNEYNRVKTNIDQWKRYDNNLLAYNQSVAEYPQKKDEYEKAAAEGMKNKTVKFIAISEGIKGRMYDGEATDFVDYLSDNRFWTRKHRRTDLGRIRTGRDNAIRRLGNSKILDKAIDRLMGPTVKSYGELSDKYVFEAECFDVNDPKAVPGLPLSETRPENYQVPTEYLNGGKALTDREISVICFAALADGRVSSAPPLEGYDEENSTMLNFAEVLNDFFLEGIPRSDHLLPFLNRARNLGSNLVRIYAETGDNTDISKMLANCVRNLNHQAFVHSLNPEKHFVVCGALRPIMDVFDKHPELLKASGLEEGELKEAQSNLLIHEVCVKGREAKVKLGDYGLHLIDLSVQERKEYMKDVLAMEAMDQRLHEEWQTRELDIYTKSMNKDDREFRYKLRTTLRGLAKEMSVLVDTITLAESEEKDTTELWQKLDENRKAYQEAQRKYQHSYLGYEKTKTEKRKLGVSNESIGNLAHKEEQKKIVAGINKKLSSDQLLLASDGIDKDLFDVAPPQGSGGIGNKMSSDDLSGTVVSMKKKLSTDNLDLAKHFEGRKEKRRSTRHQEKRAENREVMANLKYFMYYDNTSKFKAELNRESLDVAKKNLEELPAFSRLVKSEPEELAKYLVAPGAVAANIGEASSVFVPIKRTKSTKNLFKQTKDVNVDKIQDAFDDSGETSFELDTKTQYSKKRKFAPPKKKSESSIFSGNLLFQEDMDQNDSDSLRRYSMGTSSQEDSPKKGSSKKGIFQNESPKKGSSRKGSSQNESPKKGSSQKGSSRKGSLNKG